MEDADELSRREVASKIFERAIRSQVQTPIDSTDAYIEKPVLVTPYRAAPDVTGFWRIPVASRKHERIIGFFDVRKMDEEAGAIRVSRLPRRTVRQEEELKNLPIDILELSESDIYEQVKVTLGSDIKFLSGPELVFDQAETRVGWKVVVEQEGKTFPVIVTPGYAYAA